MVNESKKIQNEESTTYTYQCKLTKKECLHLIIFICLALLTIIFTIFFLLSIFNRGIALDSVVSVVLAIFSMSMAILFYFKADEAGKKFYESSYVFMKEQSKLLGEINARFSEKFDNVNNNLKSLKKERKYFEQKKNENSERIQLNSSLTIEFLEKKIDEYKKALHEITSEVDLDYNIEVKIDKIKKIVNEVDEKYSADCNQMDSLKKNLEDSYKMQMILGEKIERLSEHQMREDENSEDDMHGLYDFLTGFEQIQDCEEVKKLSNDEILKIQTTKMVEIKSDLYFIFLSLNMCNVKGIINEKGRIAIEKLISSRGCKC